MSKFKIDNKDSSLNPYAEEDVLSGRNQVTAKQNDPFMGASHAALEDFSTMQVDSGQSLYGNTDFAGQVINERKAYDQGSLELLAKGLGNVVKTIGIETLKMPGYAGGAVAALGNEIFGDGKNSISKIVDNAWINKFEALDQTIKDAMPIYMSKQVQEGNLLDKMSSGAWWAESGASGVGFMAAMFLPGMGLKALDIGAKIAEGGEALANISTKLGKAATGDSWLAKAGLMDVQGAGVWSEANMGFKYTKDFARNANGLSSAAINTVLESSAEAANTFDNVKKNYLEKGLTDQEAGAKAGEAASAVFKGNLALLAVSNLLDEAWIWKTIGTTGEKEAAQSMMSKLFKDGVPDMEALKTVGKEFSKANTLKKLGTNFTKNAIKEGAFEEGGQTTLQQNIEKGNIDQTGNKLTNVFGDLSNVVSSYFDDFANNKELHESVFLGALLGGLMSVHETIQENNALKKTLYGGEARTRDNSVWTKYGLLPETKAQKGLNKILTENHIAQFRSYKDFVTKDEDGNTVIDEQKQTEAHLQQLDELRTSIMYDIAAFEGDKTSQEIYGQFLAATYAHPFLQQEGGKELFDSHVDQQVLPAWKSRFEDTFGREATSKEQSDYTQRFKKSGERVFKAYEQAEQTNYPERYYHEKSKEYQDFKDFYFHRKFQTLLALDAVKERHAQLNQEMVDKGISELDLEDLSKLTDPVKIQDAALIKLQQLQLKKKEARMAEDYPTFFTKEGVKDMYDAFMDKKKEFEQVKENATQENKDLKEKVNGLPAKNEKELQRILDQADGYSEIDSIPLKDKKGNVHELMYNPENGQWNLLNKDGVTEVRNFKGDLSDLGLMINDVSQQAYDEFKNTGKASEPVLNSIAEKLNNGEELSFREESIKEKLGDEIQAIQEKLKAKPAPVVQPTVVIDEDEPNKTFDAIDKAEKKKGVNLYPSTGRNAKNELIEKNGVFVEELNPKPSQVLWFKTLEDEVSKDPEAYTVQVVRKDDKSNEELFHQIERDSDPTNSKAGDLYTVLYKDGKPVTKEGNYVFTGLWRPDSLYPLLPDGRPKEFILAESAILENFLTKINMSKLNLDRLSKKEKDQLELLHIEPTKTGIRTAAFMDARQEYSEWYSNLQNNPSQLQIKGVTNGHAVKMFEDKKGTKPVWGKPLQGIPKLRLEKSEVSKPSDLKGGRFELSIEGNIKVDGEEIKIARGDTVIVDDDGNVHAMRARNLDAKEINTILYLLSLRAGTDQPTETIKITPPTPIRFGINDIKDVPVFYNEEKKDKGDSHKNLIETLMSFGSKDETKGSKKGEIYFNQQSVINGNPVLVWTDFNGQTHNMDVQKIKNAIDNGDQVGLNDLYEFLKQKRFNINEHLLGSSDKVGNPTFHKPNLVYVRNESGNLVPSLEWDSSKSYYDHLLNDVLTTTTHKLEGYPNRLQRNAWFDKTPISDVEVYSDLTWDESAHRSSIGSKYTSARIAFDNSSEGTVFEMVTSTRSTKGHHTGVKGNMVSSETRVVRIGNFLVEESDIGKPLHEVRQYDPDLLDKNNKQIFLTEVQNTLVVEEPVKPKSQRRARASRDEFRDKILTTSELLKSKIESGEIKQNCK